MNYIEALNKTKGTSFQASLDLVFGFSGSTHTLMAYLNAAAAMKLRKLECEVPNIGHFHKFLVEKQTDPNLISMLFPWDLAPGLDWRSGIPITRSTFLEFVEEAERFFDVFSNNSNYRSFYVDAAIPPVLSSFPENQLLRHSLTAVASKHGFHILGEPIFDLSSYLRSGCPIASSQLWQVAELLCNSALTTAGLSKVLVTDCDNVLWAGVIAEDKCDGIQLHPDGLGYGHFIYQTYLKQLVRSGILIAAVTRNHRDDIKLAFSKSGMLLNEDDFVAVMAGYQSKSSRITALSQSLNLGLSSFVFIDDNPVEIADINNNLPEVTTLIYPKNEKDFPEFYSRLNYLFSRDYVTDEDLLRLESYRTSLKLAPSMREKSGGIDDFLRDLNMTLSISEKTTGNLERTVQLLNKTNQFNCNGYKVTEKLLDELLDKNARLFGATLTDKGGNHGEILSILIDASGEIQYFAISCRVFERYVEHVFFYWLFNAIEPITSINYRPTKRNEPFQYFLTRLAIETPFNILSDSQATMLPQDLLRSTNFLTQKREFIAMNATISS
jgi:FkbH-like protein